jgi:hypothetical protein
MDFIKNIFPYLPQLALATAVLICFLHSNTKPRYFKLFSFFWLFILLVEMAGHALGKSGFKNHWLYNISYFVAYLFLPYFFSRFPLASFLRRIFPGYAIAFTLFFLVLVLYEKPFTELLTPVIVSGGLAVIFFAAYYLRQLYKSDEISPVQKDPHFWISIGFLFYYAGLTPFLGMLNYLWEHYPGFTKGYNLIINYGFTILLNTFICIAYLCPKKDFQK